VADQSDEYILTEITQREFTLDVQQTASFDVTVINGGPIVATFTLRTEGLEPLWVEVNPTHVNLFEGERATFHVNITPPRSPGTRAGEYHFGVNVLSSDYPGHLNRMGCVLTVNPFYEYHVTELSPRQQGISWGRRIGRASFSVSNLGNSLVPYRIDAQDDEHACQFEFQVAEGAASLAKQAEVRLEPEEVRLVRLTIEPLRRKFFGWSGHTHSYTVNVAPLDASQMPRSLLAQAISQPLIGPWHVFALVLLICVAIAFLFRPVVSDFQADLPEVLSSEIMAGRVVTLTYGVSWFARAAIDPEIGRVEGTRGTVEVAPTETTTYRLTATDFLTFLWPSWFSDSQELTVIVDPVTPIVRFTSDKDRIVTGETATLSWEVLNAEQVVLKTNGAPETLPPEQHTGSLVVSPEAETTYILEARNQYTEGQAVVRTVLINAINPTPTPLPLPVIQRFDVLPNTITAGEEVVLEWSVTGVEDITIEGLGNFPPVGRTVVKPDVTTSYQLVATNGQAPPVRSLREVVVNPQPTATPVPGTPQIALFTVNFTEVALGSNEANNVQIAWSVTGEYINIELSGETLGRLSGLEAQGSRIVPVGDQAGAYEFVLAASNGEERVARQSVEVTVIVPQPTISGLSPSSKFVGDGAFTLTVTGANFVQGAVVRWDGVDRPTNYVNGFQLTASIPISDIDETGEFAVIVVNPATAGAQESGPATFKVNNPTPIISSVTPAVAIAGDADTTITVLGNGFVPVSVVQFNGVDLKTTFSSSTQLKAVIPEANLATAGTFTIAVFNPEPVGGSSGALTFTVENPVPTLTSLGPPSFATVGSGSFTLTINGTGFVSGKNASYVSWDSKILPAIYNSETQLQVNIQADDLLQVKSFPGNAVQVAVINPPPVQSGGVSNSLPFEIRKNGTSVSIAASPGAAVSGELITFTAYVTPAPGGLQSPLRGKVVFKQGDVVIGECIRGNPEDPPPPCWTDDPVSASITRRYGAGPVAITAQYDGSNDPNFASSQFTPFNYTVGEAGVRITITSNSPRAFNVSSEFQATVAAASPGSNDPCPPTLPPSGCGTGAGTGTVTFMANGSALGAPVLANGSGVYVVTTSPGQLAVGNVTITASYDGTADPNFTDGTSQSYTHTITKIQPTVSLSASPGSPTTYGQAFTLTATVQDTGGGVTLKPANGTPITFKNGTTTLGTGFLSDGVATLPFSATQLNAGSYSFTAEFPGDANFSSNTSSPLSHLINKVSTSITLNPTSPNPSLRGQSVTLTASVSAGSVTAPSGGTITFFDFGTTLATVNASFGSASYSPTLAQLAAGSHSFTAVFNGFDPNYATSGSSGAIAHTVNKNTPSFMLRNSVNGSSSGFVMDSGNVTWTVSVTSGSASGVPAPSGSVTFFYSSNYNTDHCHPFSWHFNLPGLAVSIVNGEASYTRNLLNFEGSNQMFVSYAGDANYNSANATMVSNNSPGVTCNDP
jgi:hypothetical protein